MFYLPYLLARLNWSDNDPLSKEPIELADILGGSNYLEPEVSVLIALCKEDSLIAPSLNLPMHFDKERSRSILAFECLLDLLML